MKLSQRLAAEPATAPSPKAPRQRVTRTAPVARAMPVATSSLDDLRIAVRDGVVSEVGPRLSEAVVDDVQLRGLVEKHLDRALRVSSVAISPAERHEFIEATLADMVGWGVLTPLMSDPSVTEVMCNGHSQVFVEREGTIELTDLRFPSEAALRQVIDRMLSVAGRRIDEASPMADGRLADGSRINAIIPPLSLVGPVLTVRRFPESSLSVADLISRETFSTDAAVFLEAAVRGKLNVVVSGGTSTGKTTLLNVLSSFVPPAERVVTIEDAAELRLAQPHVVSLEARPANIEGAGRVTIRDLVRNALRMRPDRIVVGEVRGGEALDMLQAMNTGHEGSLTTVHANSPRDALLRLETMVLMSGLDLPLRAIREQIASAIDIVVQVGRRRDGGRVVTSISEVQGREGDTITLQEIFHRGGESALRATGLRPHCVDRLAERGADVPAHVFRGAPQLRLGRSR
ncbi:MAG TPA: CpaF family protein [Mycobacteriales bacterium]|nr:CpaF family protein [Mycobacteriales bacterium]